MQPLRAHDRRRPAFEAVDPFTPRSLQRQRTLPDIKDVDEIDLPPQRPYQPFTPSSVPQILPGPIYYSPAQYNQPLPIFPHARSATPLNSYPLLYGYAPFQQYRHSPPESTRLQSVSPSLHVWCSVPTQRSDFQSSLNTIPEHNTPNENHSRANEPASKGETSLKLASAATSDNKLSLQFDLLLFVDLIRNAYLLVLLNIPRLYFSRVERILKEAHLTIEEMKEMSLVSSPAYINALQEDMMETGSYNLNAKYLSPAYERLITAWELLINSLLHDWNILNVMTVLLLTAIMSIFQINGAATDPFTRYTGFWSLICALMSLMYSCVFLTQFGSMRQPYKALEWAIEAQKAQAIFWNVWVMLATPVVWMSWSIIAFILSIMSFMWRVGTTSSGHSASTSPEVELILRVLLSFLLFMGLVYGILIITTLRRYGSRMDNAWERRINDFITRNLPTHSSEKQPSALAMSTPRRSRSSQIHNHLSSPRSTSSTSSDAVGMRSNQYSEPSPAHFEPQKWPIIPSTPIAPLGTLAEEVFLNGNPVNPLAAFESPDEFTLPGTSVDDEVQQSVVLSTLPTHDGHHEHPVANTDTPPVEKDEERSLSHVYETGGEKPADSGDIETSNFGTNVFQPLLFRVSPRATSVLGSINLPRIAMFNDEMGTPNQNRFKEAAEEVNEVDEEIGRRKSDESVQTNYSLGILVTGGPPSHYHRAGAGVGEDVTHNSIHTDKSSSGVETQDHSCSQACVTSDGTTTSDFVETPCSETGPQDFIQVETQRDQPPNAGVRVRSPLVSRLPTPSNFSSHDESTEIVIFTKPHIDSNPPSPMFIRNSLSSPHYMPVSQDYFRSQTSCRDGEGTNRSPAPYFDNWLPGPMNEHPPTAPLSATGESPPASLSVFPEGTEFHIPTPSSSAPSDEYSRESSVPAELANDLSRSYLEILIDDGYTDSRSG